MVPELSKTDFQDGGYGGHLGFLIDTILAHFDPEIVVSELSKTDFQDGGYGGHLGFLIDTILAHFDPEIVLLLQRKFRLKSTKDLGRDGGQ